MSLAFGRKITHAVNGSPRKCRIPQRVCSGTYRPLAKSRDIPRIPSDSGVNPEKHIPKGEINKLDSTKAKIDPIGLKESWKVKKEQFDKMRDDLKERQGTIMEVYADLKIAEEELALLGQKLSSHAIENDLQIMNVAKLTPRQLLELCGETKACSPDVADKEDLAAAYFNIDVKKISNIPSKVFETCEEMLKKHMELIDLLENLKLNKNDLFHNRNGRIKDFKDEYDALKDKVQAVKTELDKDLVELTDVIRKCVKETMAVSLRNKDLTSELSRLNSKNSLPPKPINDKDHVFKQHPNKIKIEELEKKFKEEQLKNLTTKERLKKFESEAKMNENRATHLEVALEKAREENRVLKETIQNQRDQNQQSQKEFNEELCKLNNLIKKNSKNLEKIAEAKTKLQNEKKELDTQLNTVLKEKMKLQKITETQQSQFVKKDEQYKQTFKMLQDTQVKLAEALNDRGDTVKVPQVIEKDLEDAKAEIVNLNKKIAEKNKLIQKMEQRLDVTKTLEDQLRNEIEQKIKHIEDQENKCGLLEDRAKESEEKMQFYEKQIMTLEEIKNVKNKHREYGNLENLNSMVTGQKQKIQELTQRNDELTSALHNKAIELKACTHTILTQEEHIKEKDSLLSELSENKTKQTSIIESLQRDLASKVNKTDSKVNGNLFERDPEIESLVVDIRTKENRISEMEKVMIALYDQARKTKSKNKKYREKISILKQVILGYETYRDNVDLPSDYLDSLLKILENEVKRAVYYVPSGRHNFERDFLNKRCKLFHSEAERAPRILIQNDRSSSRAEPINDGHSD